MGFRVRDKGPIWESKEYGLLGLISAGRSKRAGTLIPHPLTP